MNRIIRTYHELITLPTFEERFKYLMLNGTVGLDTFGFDRFMNQQFYKSNEWKHIRHKIIVRDLGCDLGIPDMEIKGNIYIHHMNPIAPDDIKETTEYLLNPDYLVCTSFNTHNAIHYGYENPEKVNEIVTRKQNDTCPWR